MNHLIRVSVFLLCLTLLGFSQIDNVQFTTMGESYDGKSWDLYEELEKGKSVYLQCFFNG